MEYWDIYDAEGNPTGRVLPKGAVLSPEEYHLAGEVWVYDAAHRQFLLQQRSEACELLPGMWGHTTGRIRAGEDSRTGCVRELQEELGLVVAPQELQLLRRILRRDGQGLIWDVYLLGRELDPAQLTLQPEEVAAACWVDVAQMQQLMAEGRMFCYPEIQEILAQILTL